MCALEGKDKPYQVARPCHLSKTLGIQWSGACWDISTKEKDKIHLVSYSTKNGDPTPYGLVWVLETACSLFGNTTLVHMPSVTNCCHLWMGTRAWKDYVEGWGGSANSAAPWDIWARRTYDLRGTSGEKDAMWSLWQAPKWKRNHSKDPRHFWSRAMPSEVKNYTP